MKAGEEKTGGGGGEQHKVGYSEKLEHGSDAELLCRVSVGERAFSQRSNQLSHFDELGRL